MPYILEETMISKRFWQKCLKFDKRIWKLVAIVIPMFNKFPFASKFTSCWPQGNDEEIKTKISMSNIAKSSWKSNQRSTVPSSSWICGSVSKRAKAQPIKQVSTKL